jgi:hypothetical protein
LPFRYHHKAATFFNAAVQPDDGLCSPVKGISADSVGFRTCQIWPELQPPIVILREPFIAADTVFRSSCHVSRSIHTTRRTLKNLRRMDFSDRDEKATLLRQAREEYLRKRRIKRRVNEERHQPAPPLAGTDPSSIPIEIADESPHIHYPLSVDDIRSLLMALPSTATEGISRIQLLLGKEYMSESRGGDSDEPDPFSGRESYQVLPGIYSAPILGTYFRPSGQIALYAYVYGVEALPRLPLPAEATLAYLRLRAAQTLIHEVAHHHDETQRIARGRWLSDREATFENYAEKMEHEWTQTIGIPWMEARFPHETKALIDWLAEFGGCRLPLSFFATDPRVTHRNTGMRRICIGQPFESFIEELTVAPPAGQSAETHLKFAWELHYADQYERCLELVDRILSDRPDWVDALLCKADTLEHLERLDESWDFAQIVLRAQPDNEDAFRVLALILEQREQWLGLHELCTQWDALPKETLEQCRLVFLAIACCALERWAEMDHWIKKRVGEDNDRRLAFTRRQIFKRAGKELPKPDGTPH